MSCAGYYAAQRRRRQPQKPCVVRVLLKSEFETSNRTYGCRRLKRQLEDKGVQVGLHRVRRLMKEMQIKAIWKRKFINTTESRHNLPVFENVLNRNFNPKEPNQAWVSDITYIRVRNNWLYLAVVLDLYSRKLIGWAMSPTMPAELVCNALKLAIYQRQPKPGLVVHSERGSQ